MRLDTQTTLFANLIIVMHSVTKGRCLHRLCLRENDRRRGGADVGTAPISRRARCPSFSSLGDSLVAGFVPLLLLLSPLLSLSYSPVLSFSLSPTSQWLPKPHLYCSSADPQSYESPSSCQLFLFALAARKGQPTAPLSSPLLTVALINQLLLSFPF